MCIVTCWYDGPTPTPTEPNSIHFLHSFIRTATASFQQNGLSKISKFAAYYWEL